MPVGWVCLPGCAQAPSRLWLKSSDGCGEACTLLERLSEIELPCLIVGLPSTNRDIFSVMSNCPHHETSAVLAMHAYCEYHLDE